MKKLAKGILYAGGLIGSFVAGALFIAGTIVARHEIAEDADFVMNDDSMKITFIGLRGHHYEPGVYPGILEVKNH